MSEDLKIKEVKDEIQKGIDTLKEAVNSKADKAEITQLTTDLKNLGEKIADKEIVSKIEDAVKSIQKQADEMGIDLKKIGNAGGQVKKDFKSMIMEGVKSPEYIDYLKRGAKGTSGKIELKADVTVAANFVNRVIPADVLTNPLMYVDRREHIRDFISKGTTTRDKIDFPKETAYTDGVDMKAENSAAGQTDFTITESTVNVQTVDTYLNISRNMLDDADWVSSYLSERVPIKILNKEDQQILSGNNTPPQIQGIIPVASAFAAGTFAGTIAGANRLDVLRVAAVNMTVGYYKPTLVIMNPIDAAQIDLIKDKNENYVRVEMYNVVNGQSYFLNIPILQTVAMTAGQYLIGDFKMGVQLVEREGISMYVTDSHASLFINRMHTFLFEERIALPIFNTGAFVKGTFATDIAALDSGS